MTKSLIFIVACSVILQSLTGCQATSRTQFSGSPSALLADSYFSGETHEPESMQQIFQLPEQTKQKLHQVIVGQDVAERRAKAVLKLILSYADDGLLYDNVTTRTAAETLAHGRANCLSLSILAFSMAKEVGMDAVFQDVQIPEYWTSDMNQSWLNGHVNVRLSQNKLVGNDFGISLLGRDVVIDFDPNTLKNRFPEQEIAIERVVAMYHNNKAATALSEGNHAQAYRYFKAAAKIDPNFAVTWANLAVLYRLTGLYDLAEKSYNTSLTLDPTSTNTLSNLAFLYRQTGRTQQAKQLEERVIAKRRNNPYYYLMLGNEAFQRSDLTEAIAQYNQAVKLDRQNHEAYFGLAKAYLMQDNTSRASYFLEKALGTATTSQDQQRYEHKLAILNRIAKIH